MLVVHYILTAGPLQNIHNSFIIVSNIRQKNLTF